MPLEFLNFKTCCKQVKFGCVCKNTNTGLRLRLPRISDDSLDPCPGGTSDNSPAFQRWVEVSREVSPEGTAEERPAQPSLRDLGLSNPRSQR